MQVAGRCPSLSRQSDSANAWLALGIAVFARVPVQGDLQVDVTHHALASTGLPANRLAGHARISVLLSAQVTAPSINAPYAGGYVLGCRLVRARSIQEVKDMMAEPPELAEAVNELQQKVVGAVAPPAAQQLRASLTCRALRVGCDDSICGCNLMATCVCGGITLIWLQFKVMPYSHCCHQCCVRHVLLLLLPGGLLFFRACAHSLLVTRM
jgi:hypothetical protein